MTTSTQADELLVDTLDQLLADRCTQLVVDTPELWNSVWNELVGFGAPRIGISEAAGGAGGTVADAVAVLRLCGKHAAPVPIAAHFAALGVLASAGLALPDAAVTVLPGATTDSLSLEHGRLTGRSHHVPFARSADLFLGVVDRHLVLFGRDAVVIAEHENLAAEPRDHIELSGLAPTVIEPLTNELVGELSQRLMLARSAQMVGALEAVAELTVDYANERHQFGRSIVSFQAVAHRLAELVEEVSLARMALDIATNAHARDREASFETAALRAVVGHAANTVTAASHQIHGAMGMTQEYRLHHLTRRLWAWNTELGGTTGAQKAVGHMVLDPGSPDLWSIVAGSG